MNSKSLLVLALASAFALSTSQAFGEDEKKETEKPQLIAEDEKKETEKPQLIAEDEKKETEKPQLIAEGDEGFPKGSTPELVA
jgi:hypothetical protein